MLLCIKDDWYGESVGIQYVSQITKLDSYFIIINPAISIDKLVHKSSRVSMLGRGAGESPIELLHISCSLNRPL